MRCLQTYYDAIKRELGGRAARTRAAMDALDPGLRVAMEGFRPGAYLRLRFAGGFLACHPMQISGVCPEQFGNGRNCMCSAASNHDLRCAARTISFVSTTMLKTEEEGITLLCCAVV